MREKMSFPVSYRENLLQTIQTIDEKKVSQAIDWFREAATRAARSSSPVTEAAPPRRRILSAT